MKKVGSSNAPPTVASGSSHTAVGGIPMRRLGSSQSSRTPSALSIRPRDSPILRGDASSPGKDSYHSWCLRYATSHHYLTYRSACTVLISQSINQHDHSISSATRAECHPKSVSAPLTTFRNQPQASSTDCVSASCKSGRGSRYRIAGCRRLIIV
jgi:hypothetical protein